MNVFATPLSLRPTTRAAATGALRDNTNVRLQTAILNLIQIKNPVAKWPSIAKSACQDVSRNENPPGGAVTKNIKGVTYFHFGAAYYRPFYNGSSVIYEVVAKPS